MEELQRRHVQEQKDLTFRISQKKRNATKKTRKFINDECAELERQLRQKQDQETISHNEQSKAGTADPETVQLADQSDPGLHESENEGAQLELRTPREAKSDAALQDDKSNSKITGNNHVKKPNRQQARKARRAAEQHAAIEAAEREAAAEPDHRARESESMQAAFQEHGLVEQDIRSDGHCLYAAIADQLKCHHLELKSPTNASFLPALQDPDYLITRHVAASYIEQHAERFEPFLEQPLREYTSTIRDTAEWGGHLELLALVCAYNVKIHILQAERPIEKMEPENSSTSQTTLWLAYYRHNFGLGEHYNSLRPKG